MNFTVPRVDDNQKTTFDCEVTLSTDFANRMLGAVSYPVELQLREGNEQIDAQELSFPAPEPAEQDTTEEPASQSSQTDTNPIIEDVWTPESLAGRNDSTPSAKSQKRCTAEVTDLKVTLLSQPRVLLANPVEVFDIPLSIEAKIKLSIRMLGKWRTFNLNLSDVRLASKQALLHISADSHQVTLTPEFKNLDLAVGLKIFKWKLGYRFGITRHVNQRLPEKTVPLQRLLAAAELPDVFNTPPQFADVEVTAISTGVRVGANFVMNHKEQDNKAGL